MDRGAWQATVPGVTRVGHDLVTKQPPPPTSYSLSVPWCLIPSPQATAASSLVMGRAEDAGDPGDEGCEGETPKHSLAHVPLRPRSSETRGGLLPSTWPGTSWRWKKQVTPSAEWHFLMLLWVGRRDKNFSWWCVYHWSSPRPFIIFSLAPVTLWSWLLHIQKCQLVILIFSLYYWRLHTLVQGTNRLWHLDYGSNVIL